LTFWTTNKDDLVAVFRSRNLCMRKASAAVFVIATVPLMAAAQQFLTSVGHRRPEHPVRGGGD